jgi:vitamin B12 transport system substrate-binding protein
VPGDIPVVASLGTVDFERILGIKPTFCATVRGMQDPQVLSDLDRFGLVVVQYPVDSLDQLWACMEDLGTRVGRAQAGRVLATSCKARVSAVRLSRTGPRPRALLLVGDEPAVVAGEGTFLGEVLLSAGFENAAAPLSGYPQVDIERLARWKPDFLVFPQGDIRAAGVGRLADSIHRILGKRPALVGIPADILVRPGPQTADAVERLATERLQLVNPETPAGSKGRMNDLPEGSR